MEPDWDLRPRQVVDATSVTAGGTSSAIASAVGADDELESTQRSRSVYRRLQLQ